MSMLWYMFKRNRGSSRLKGSGSVTVQNGSHDTILEMSLSQSTTTEVFFALLRAAWVAVEGRVGERQMSSKKEKRGADLKKENFFGLRGRLCAEKSNRKWRSVGETREVRRGWRGKGVERSKMSLKSVREAVCW